MTRLERIGRVLRDLGIFLLGIAAFTVAIDYLFIRSDPLRDMQRAMTKSFVDGMEKRLNQRDSNSQSDSGSKAPTVETGLDQ